LLLAACCLLLAACCLLLVAGCWYVNTCIMKYVNTCRMPTHLLVSMSAPSNCAVAPPEKEL
jgi:hypothetical protein